MVDGTGIPNLDLTAKTEPVSFTEREMHGCPAPACSQDYQHFAEPGQDQTLASQQRHTKQRLLPRVGAQSPRAWVLTFLFPWMMSSGRLVWMRLCTSVSSVMSPRGTGASSGSGDMRDSSSCESKVALGAATPCLLRW